jgi:hypothetical protein
MSAPKRNSTPDQYDKLDGSSSSEGADGSCLLSTQAVAGVVEPLAADDAGDCDAAPPDWYNPSANFTPLNCCDWSALWEQRRWLGQEVERLLDSIEYRIEQWPRRFARPKH